MDLLRTGTLMAASLALGAMTAAPEEKAAPAALDADPHLAGWWKLDDASGKTAADASGHRRDGTLRGDASFEQLSALGRIGKAVALQGDRFVEVSGYKGVSGTRPRTVAAWIKTKSDRGEILSWGKAEFGKRWVFGFIRGRAGVTPHGGYLYMNAAVHDDAWHHVAAVVVEGDPPNLHDHVVLYKDGERAEIHDIGLLDLWPIETIEEQDVRIGRGFQGLIDDVRIYDRALSADEVKVLFDGKSDRPLPAAKS